MDELCQDIVIEIASWLPTLSLLRFQQTSKRYWNLKHKCKGKACVDRFRSLSWKRRWERGLLEAVTVRDFELICYFISKGACNWNQAIEKAARDGPNEILNFLLDNAPECNAKWISVLKGAARGGHTQLVQDAINKADCYTWNDVIRQAARGGHAELVNFFLKKIRPSRLGIAIHSACKGAAIGGHLELLRSLHSIPIPPDTLLACVPYCTPWAGAFHPHIMEYLTEVSNTGIHPQCGHCLEHAFSSAGKRGNQKLVEHFMQGEWRAFQDSFGSCGFCRAQGVGVLAT